MTRGRDVTLTLNGVPLRGPIDHPIINLATYVQGGLYDYDAMAALTVLLEPGQLFIDVGVNIGPYSVLAAGLVGASGQIVAVEPSADQLSYLRRNLQDLPAECLISTAPLADRPRAAGLVAKGPTIQHFVESSASDAVNADVGARCRVGSAGSSGPRRLRQGRRRGMGAGGDCWSPAS